MEKKQILGLSLYQPWATLIALGAKQYETRPWDTPYRGIIAIHSTKSFSEYDRRLCNEEPFNKFIKDADSLPLGSIVALARIEEIYRTEYCHQIKHGSDEEAFGDYSWGRYAWKLTDVIALPEPIQCKGNRKLWNINSEIAAKLEAFLPG